MAQTQLTLAQRYKIYRHLQTDISKRKIAMLIQSHHSTVYREIERNSMNGQYDPDVAEKMSNSRRVLARKHRKISQETWLFVEKFLKLNFSPEQISGFFRRSGAQIISHESIYQHVREYRRTGETIFSKEHVV